MPQGGMRMRMTNSFVIYNPSRMTVARVFINGMDAEAFRQSFHVIFTAVKKLHPKFEVGKSLHGIIMDWADAHIKGLEEMWVQMLLQK